MTIRSNLAAPGLLRERTLSVSGLPVQWWEVPLLLRLVLGILFCTMMLTLSVLTVSRTSEMPKIGIPSAAYLPGNTMPEMAKETDCFEGEGSYQSCIIHVLSQTIYLTYAPSSRMIVRTAIKAREYKIGELITAWGNPSGFTQEGDSVFVYWGKRCAILYTQSFRPESVVAFIQYDFDPQQASVWQGFNHKPS